MRNLTHRWTDLEILDEGCGESGVVAQVDDRGLKDTSSLYTTIFVALNYKPALPVNIVAGTWFKFKRIQIQSISSTCNLPCSNKQDQGELMVGMQILRSVRQLQVLWLIVQRLTRQTDTKDWPRTEDKCN